MIEAPQLLVIQGRTDQETITSERQAIAEIVRTANPAMELTFVNPLSEDPWQGTDILRRGFAGSLVLGSSNLDFSQKTSNREQYKKRTFRVIEELLAHEIPTLGICLGHQAIGLVAGGTVSRMNKHGETGTVELQLTTEGVNHPIFEKMTSPIKMYYGHKDSLETKPPGAVILGRTADNGETPGDPYSALQIGSAITIQGHPEITDLRHARSRMALSKGSLLGEYVQTHPFTEPDKTDLIIGNFITGISQRRIQPV